MKSRGRLLVIGSNPPSQTSGERTIRRVDLARASLGFGEAHIANLFSLASYRSGAVTTLGSEADGWLAARTELHAGLQRADGLLMAYGVQAPSGPARAHHREQLGWIVDELSLLALPVGGVGGAPRHPSRWQRFTSRAYPQLPFHEALKRSMICVKPQHVAAWVLRLHVRSEPR